MFLNIYIYIYIFLFSSGAPPKKKQRGTRGGKGRTKVQNMSVECMENAQDGQDDIVQDLRLSDLE
jgi:hypothetical protein